MVYTVLFLLIHYHDERMRTQTHTHRASEKDTLAGTDAYTRKCTRRGVHYAGLGGLFLRRMVYGSEPC